MKWGGMVHPNCTMYVFGDNRIKFQECYPSKIQLIEVGNMIKEIKMILPVDAMITLNFSMEGDKYVGESIICTDGKFNIARVKDDDLIHAMQTVVLKVFGKIDIIPTFLQDKYSETFKKIAA